MPAEPLDPVIHQQTRLQILGALFRNHRASFTDLRDGLNLTPGNLASHVARLEEANYVRSQRVLTGAGFEAQYVITQEGVQAFTSYLAAFRSLVSAGVDLSGLSGKLSAEVTSSDSS